MRDAFNAALTAVLAASGPPLLSGCGGDGGADNHRGIDTDPGFLPVNCSDVGPRFLPDLNPNKQTEYIELSVRRTSVIGDLFEARGLRCAGATDRVGCENEFLALGSATGFPFGFCGDTVCQGRLTVTQGNAASLIDSLDGLVAFLAPIDVAAEAILIMQASGIDVPCNTGGTTPADDGFLVQGYVPHGCGGLKRDVRQVDSAGKISVVDSTVVVQPKPGCTPGRRPAGLLPSAPGTGGRHTSYWACAARLEAASVYAFRRLRSELRLHGAPKSLANAALRAARDEIRHARLVSKLAQQFGATVDAVRIEAVPLRDLEAIAIENATEGCVRETFAALVNQWQARYAKSRRVRLACRQIAKDELRHAALAWRIDAWVKTRLSPAARARLRVARQDAVDALLAELSWQPSRELVEQAGIPPAAQARALAEHVRQSIWS